MKKAYIKNLFDEETREIPNVKIGMYIGDVVEEGDDDYLILLNEELQECCFGWERVIDGSTKRMWWIRKSDIKFIKGKETIEIE